jgi:hypothetical protein
MDTIFFIRNTYVFVKHIAPFSIASLVLLTLSVPEDNLLLKLATQLEQPGAIYIPAILLTLGTSVIYIITIWSLSKRMYLWPRFDPLRTLFTAAISIVACTAMAYGVMPSTVAITNTYANLWACYLVAILCLTGVGWSGLGNWIEAMGIRYPDYESARQSAGKIAVLLKDVRQQQKGTERNVDDFLKAAGDLRDNIEKNLILEPEWAHSKLGDASNSLRELIEGVKNSILVNKEMAVSDFAAIFKYQKKFEYPDVIKALEELNIFWHDWRP